LQHHQEPVEDLKVTLRRFLAFKNGNAFSPIVNRMSGNGEEKKEQEGQESHQKVAAKITPASVLSR
jgi:hypothetical protein